LKDFEDSRTMIYNLFLSSNILGLEFKKVLEESGNLITIQPYLIGYLEHLGPNDIRKIIETGGGVAGTFDMGMDKISLTPQLTGVTAGLGGNWNIVPRLSLYNNLRLSRHFSLYQSASVHYTFPATDILEKIKTQHFGGEWGGGAGLGFYYNMSTHWRMKLGGEYEYAPVGYETAPGGLPVQMFDVSGRIAYKSLSLEAQASYQLDKQYGPENLPYLGPGVAAGKIALVYNFGTLDFTPKHKATQKKVGK
jgi:hypothetical protein